MTQVNLDFTSQKITLKGIFLPYRVFILPIGQLLKSI